MNRLYQLSRPVLTNIYICLGLLGTVFILNCSKAPHSDQQFPKSEIRDYNGVPTIFINGEPNAGMTYMTYNPKEKHYRQFGEIGVDLASFQTSANYNFYWDDPPVWVSRDSFDFSLLDEEMNMLVRANPDVWIFPRVYLWSTPWWDKENPDELMKYSDGTKTKPIWAQDVLDKRKNTLPSWASEKWREDTAYCLRNFIEHVRSQPYGRRVIGYQIASGSTEEWFYWIWHTYDNKELKIAFLDYSEPQLKAFRDWLRKKYGTNDKLREAWRNNKVTFETAEIPTSEARSQTEFMFFRDPKQSQPVIDYNFFHSELVTETISYFARVVKDATNGESLAGAFYGYTLELIYMSHIIIDAGHLALRKMLECPDLDFITSPSCYAFRYAGVGHSPPTTELESIKLHGKLWFDENDYRTHLCPVNAGFGRAENLKDSEAAQFRQLSNHVTQGIPAWWFDMGGGWYDQPEFLEVINKLNEIAERSIHYDRRSAAEIAIVVDEHSLCYTERSNRLTKPLLYTQRLQIGRIGAPVDYILLDDLNRAKDYKMYVFLNAFHVSGEQQEEIDRLASRGAKALFWVYAPGFVGETLDIKNSEKLTGLKINYTNDTKPLEVVITSQGRNVLSIAEENLTYGTGGYINYNRPNVSENGEISYPAEPATVVGPVFYGDDPDAEVLGIIKTNGKPGLIRKEVNGMQVYYSAAPNIASAVFRGAAEKAGVHIYTKENDSFYANKSFVAVHTKDAGGRTLRFSDPTDVYDVYNEKIIAENAKEVSVQLPEKHTILYFLGSEAEWKAAN